MEDVEEAEADRTSCLFRRSPLAGVWLFTHGGGRPPLSLSLSRIKWRVADSLRYRGPPNSNRRATSGFAGNDPCPSVTRVVCARRCEPCSLRGDSRLLRFHFLRSFFLFRFFLFFLFLLVIICHFFGVSRQISCWKTAIYKVGYSKIMSFKETNL